MTVEEIEDLMRLQVGGGFGTNNDHGINLRQALVPPQRISVIARIVQDGRVKDEKLDVWLVGQEPSSDGYRIILRDDGLQFGLASSGFPTDKYPILVGWYGGLMSAFLSM
jgi:hypothetical protein